MALSDTSKLNIAFKKLIGKDHSTNTKQWYEEWNGGGFNVHAQNSWADTIPSAPPGSTTSVVKVYTDAADGALKLIQDVTVSGLQGWMVESPPGTRLRGFIPPSYAQAYTVRLYEDDGSGTAKGPEIFTTDAMDWFFDYETGYLAIQDSHSYTTPFWIEAYYYIGDSVEDRLGASPVNNSWQAMVDAGSISQWHIVGANASSSVGQVQLSDADGSTKNVIGVNITAGISLAGTNISVASNGRASVITSDAGAWAHGDPVFMSDIAGQVTSDVSSFIAGDVVQQVGFSIDTSTSSTRNIIVSIGTPIEL